MKSGNRDKAEGKLHEIKGKVKEQTGKLTGSPKLKREGTDEQIAGKVQGDVGDIKKALGK
ncbi:CsbD family protein [Pelovirga terrestris]|uniref:CsbD family protein n=1 Tax=Pelovirga terrestris TaxID=2771352 RepID=A0A8J6UL45_9BACT|nr:CsbD family protein [Pelovirga terrestris]MBD1400577.1 CsbD family protein [Pelovirga terrestris]